MSNVKPLPFVEAHEVDEAKGIIDKQFIEMTGKPFDFRPAGYYIACKLYVRPDELMEVTDKSGKKITLYTAEVSKKQDELTSVSALVCAVGDQAYTGVDKDGNERFPGGPWARVGDWVCLPRHSSFVVKYRGVAMAIIPDDKVIAVIEDPTDLTEFYVGNKV
jgi:hypothetical protein